jgi:hypothetical protein
MARPQVGRRRRTGRLLRGGRVAAANRCFAAAGGVNRRPVAAFGAAGHWAATILVAQDVAATNN